MDISKKILVLSTVIAMVFLCLHLYWRPYREAERQITRADTLSRMLQDYNAKTGRWPSSLVEVGSLFSVESFRDLVIDWRIPTNGELACVIRPNKRYRIEVFKSGGARLVQESN